MFVRRLSKNVLFVAVAVTAALLSLLFGWIDIHSATSWWGENWFYFAVCLGLGVRTPKAYWLWPFVFAFSLYGIHLWALAHGYRQPYVERDASHASACLDVFLPAIMGGIVGGMVGGIARMEQRR